MDGRTLSQQELIDLIQIYSDSHVETPGGQIAMLQRILDSHRCKYVCNVCFDGECSDHPKRTIHCDCVEKLITGFRKPRFKGYCFFTHCAARFDSFLILEYFCKAGIILDIIMQGCKLIFNHDEAFDQRYIDSYSFMALSKMPDALGIFKRFYGYDNISGGYWSVK